jgi:large subunit ribosomal protein L32
MVVRMRHTRSHTRNRRSHHALSGMRLSVCEKCSKPKLPHNLCASCGVYNKNAIIDMKAQLAKKAARLKRRAKERGENAPKEEETKDEKKGS